MGLSNQKPVAYIHKEKKPLHVYISGLTSAGKTTVLYVTKFGKSVTITSTIDSNFELIVIDNISIAAIDEGGRSGIRAIRWAYYRRASGFIFVVDSNDREMIDKAREELHRMANEEELRNKPILILANKQDLPNSMTFDELRDKLNLDKLNENTKWHLQLTCAIQNEGLHEGFKWLTKSMVEKVDPMKPLVETFNDTTTMKNVLLSILDMANIKRFLNKFV